jgi:hypothetical protein
MYDQLGGCIGSEHTHIPSRDQCPDLYSAPAGREAARTRLPARRTGRTARIASAERRMAQQNAQLARRQRPEAEIQRAIFQHLRARAAPGVFAFHPANGGYRKPVEAAIMKGLGVVAGVPDVIAIHEGRCYAVEIKAPGGRATAAQLETLAAMEAAGAYCCIAEGLDRALAVLEAWGLLVGRSQ